MEVQHALAIRPNLPYLDNDFIPEVALLGSICAGLVNFDQSSNVVRLVHYTAQEYFDKTPVWLLDAEADLAKTCVTYLSFDAFAAGSCQTAGELRARQRLNPLYYYAAEN